MLQLGLCLPISDKYTRVLRSCETHWPSGGIKIVNNYLSAIDRRAVLNKILSNGECGCRGEDGNQSRLNASANLERPVQNRPFGFLAAKKKKNEPQKTT
jgi:hypothetical protein